MSRTVSNLKLSDHHLAWLILCFSTLCWGANAVFGRVAVGEISPMLLVSLRWLGVLILMMVGAHREIRKDRHQLRINIKLLFLLGLLGFAVFTMLYYLAAHTTTAINIGIVQGSIPVFVLIGVYLAYRTPISVLQVLGVILTLLGVVLVVTSGNPAGLLSLRINPGDLFMIMACFSYAAYTVGLRRRPQVHVLSLFSVMSAVAFIISVPFTLLEWGMGFGQLPTATGWVVVLLIIVFPSFLAQLGFIHSVALIGPDRAGIFINLVPVFASIMAVFYLGESFKIYHAVSLMLVLGGIALSEWQKHK